MIIKDIYINILYIIFILLCKIIRIFEFYITCAYKKTYILSLALSLFQCFLRLKTIHIYIYNLIYILKRIIINVSLLYLFCNINELVILIHVSCVFIDTYIIQMIMLNTGNLFFHNICTAIHKIRDVVCSNNRFNTL